MSLRWDVFARWAPPNLDENDECFVQCGFILIDGAASLEYFEKALKSSLANFAPKYDNMILHQVLLRAMCHEDVVFFLGRLNFQIKAKIFSGFSGALFADGISNDQNSQAGASVSQMSTPTSMPSASQMSTPTSMPSASQKSKPLPAPSASQKSKKSPAPSASQKSKPPPAPSASQKSNPSSLCEKLLDVSLKRPREDSSLKEIIRPDLLLPPPVGNISSSFDLVLPPLQPSLELVQQLPVKKRYQRTPLPLSPNQPVISVNLITLPPLSTINKGGVQDPIRHARGNTQNLYQSSISSGRLCMPKLVNSLNKHRLGSSVYFEEPVIVEEGRSTYNPVFSHPLPIEPAFMPPPPPFKPTAEPVILPVDIPATEPVAESVSVHGTVTTPVAGEGGFYPSLTESFYSSNFLDDGWLDDMLSRDI